MPRDDDDRHHRSSRSSKHGRDRDRSRSRDRDRDHHKSSKSSHRDRTPPKRIPVRQRRPTGFDVLPHQVTPEIIGAPPAGSIPQPGMPGGPPAEMPVAAPVAPMGAPPGSAAALAAPSQQATRHARRVYVGGLPPTANEQNIATFMSNALAAVGGTTAGPGPCVVNVYINYEKKFAFVEFRTVEETSNAMALDGIMFEGVSVRVRRPNDYNPAAAATLGPANPNPALNLTAIGLQPGGGGGGLTGQPGGMDAADRVFVGGLPYYLNEEQCRELLSSFGALKAFDLVKDRDTGQSKGYGFVVYMDPGVTDVACAGLNGMRMGERTLTVRRATEHNRDANQPTNMGIQPAAAPAMPPMMPEAPPSRIISLLEAVTKDELTNDEEYTEIVEDMRDECGKYGQVLNVVIPRPGQGGAPDPPGVGKVIVEYADVTAAMAGRQSMHGRRFAGRTVVATFLPEPAYGAGQF
jgi:splicing factor U2AF subunit